MQMNYFRWLEMMFLGSASSCNAVLSSSYRELIAKRAREVKSQSHKTTIKLAYMSWDQCAVGLLLLCSLSKLNKKIWERCNVMARKTHHAFLERWVFSVIQISSVLMSRIGYWIGFWLWRYPPNAVYYVSRGFSPFVLFGFCRALLLMRPKHLFLAIMKLKFSVGG